MTAGLSTTHAHGLLNLFRGTNYTAPAGVYIKLHLGDPGSAGTTSPSTVTTRNQATWNAPSGGSMTLSALTGWAMTATEAITHISFWDAATSGTFLESAALTATKNVTNGDTLTLTTLTLQYTPIAA